jgi:hypothetical protein
MRVLLRIIKEIIVNQPSLELEANLTDEDKTKISKWVAKIAVDSYERGLKERR